MADISELIRSDLRKLEPYLPAQRSVSSNVIRLNANESPWHPSHAENPSWNRYPPAYAFELARSMAYYYEVDAEQVLPCLGSDQGIDLLCRLFCKPGKDRVICCPPTFDMYRFSAQVQGVNISPIPLLGERNFSIDWDAISTLDKETHSKLIFICRPNNPTGTVEAIEPILNFCKENNKTLVVIDEAYIEFSDTDSLLIRLNEYPNLVILRTLSKAHALAGIRLGAVIANSTIVNYLRSIQAPYSLPQSTIDHGISAMQRETLNQTFWQVEHIKRLRTELSEFLVAQPVVIHAWDSQANFILVEFKKTLDIHALCQQENIQIRDFSASFLGRNIARISIGSDDDQLKLIHCFRGFQ